MLLPPSPSVSVYVLVHCYGVVLTAVTWCLNVLFHVLMDGEYAYKVDFAAGMRGEVSEG